MRPAGEASALPHVLILGGTAEAYALALALADRLDVRVTSSLAGVTRASRLPAGVTRIGGFGGVAGLRQWLKANEVALVVDASHPFAVRITAQARAAAEAIGRRYLRLERPGWREVPGDRWHRVADLPAALTKLEALGAGRVFAALGARAVPALAGSSSHFVVRGIEPPALLPGNVTWLEGRGPFALADELALLAALRIEAVLARDSGGEGARAKLAAARTHGLPVVVIDRPPAIGGEAVAEVAAVLTVIEGLMARTTRS